MSLRMRIPLIQNGLARTAFTFERLAPRPDALSKWGGPLASQCIQLTSEAASFGTFGTTVGV
jgi:hypothetical protein